MDRDLVYPERQEGAMSPARAALDDHYSDKRGDSPLQARPRPPRSTWSTTLHELATPNQLAFLSIVAVQSIVVLAMIIVIFARIESNIIRSTDGLRSVQCYLALFVLGTIFELLASLDALRLKNIVQVCSIVVFTIAMLIYASLMRSQIETAIDTANGQPLCTQSGPFLDCFVDDGQKTLFSVVSPFAIVAPIMLGVAVLLLAALSWRLYREFGWESFKRLGDPADVFIYVCLLKLDSFFFLGFSKRVLTLCTRIKSDRAQFLILVLTNHDVEFGLTIAAVPLLIAWLVFSAIAVRMESKTSTAVVWAGSIIGLAYFLFKLVRLFQPSARELGYVVARKSLAVFSIISIILLILTFALSIACYRNYGKGLREVLPHYKDNAPRRRTEELPFTDGKLEQTGTRMSLD